MHTSYFNSKGEELKFVQAREERLNLDRDVGKMKVAVISKCKVDYHGCVQGKRIWGILVRRLQVQSEG